MSPERLPTGVAKWSCGSDLNDHSDLQGEKQEWSATATFISTVLFVQDLVMA
jgi:hypothetical protein